MRIYLFHIKKEKKIVLKKISVKYGVLATALSLYLCAYTFM